VGEGSLDVGAALDQLTDLPVAEIGHTLVDTHRALRCGFPEVVYGQGKTANELLDIGRSVLEHHARLLVTRIDEESAAALQAAIPECTYHDRARALTVGLPGEGEGEGLVLVVSAGTSDAGPAQEACITARMLGAHVRQLSDVGVAGIHRLLEHTRLLASARALVVVAGMEGALPSVVGGLVARPVIAVPTSVGYGASFGGVTALLAMLNSCAAGVSVVNIDNGFGAGYTAALINRSTSETTDGTDNQ